jgi:ribonuclease HII
MSSAGKNNRHSIDIGKALLAGGNNISFEIEKKLLSDGYNIIAGIDEAGRGSLAGPLAVGLAIFSRRIILSPPEELLSQIRDSKQLSPGKRNSALELINSTAVSYRCSIISHQLIDRLNINRATEYAVNELIDKITPRPDIIIMDGNFKFNVGIPILSVIKGDTKSISIASGSIVAKVTRDKIMEKYDLQYPGYLLFKNKGYGTREHQAAILKFGPCEIHRTTYEPTKSYLNRS